MSLRIGIEAVLDDAQVKTQQAELEAKNEKIKDAIEENEKRTREAFNEAMGVMRASYTIISGFSQAAGTDMGQLFSAVYGVAMGSIQTGTAIAAALAASGPAGWVQAGLMTASLLTAFVNLAGVASGQRELARKVAGLNMVLQGFGGMLDSMSFLW